MDDTDTEEFERRRQARKVLLTPEQRAIAERWEAERQRRHEMLMSYGEALQRGDKEAATIILQEALEFTLLKDRHYCEHGRAVVSTCIACEEIDRILSPELFEEEDDDADR
jgi:hypothetical protein